MNYQTINFYESGYWIRSMESDEDRMQAYRLRHTVFCDTIKWVPPHPSGLEMDRYDSFATSLGIFGEDGELAGMVRFLPPDHPFMLETDFSALVGEDHTIRKQANTVELSRLTLSRRHLLSGRTAPLCPSTLLYRGIYQWSVANGVRFLYLVVEQRFLRALLMAGFPCEIIGQIKPLPPARVTSVAAILDWEAFRSQDRVDRADFVKWVTTRPSTSRTWQQPRRDFDSRHPVLQEYCVRGN